MDEELFTLINEFLEDTYDASFIDLSPEHDESLRKALIWLSYSITSILTVNNIPSSKLLLEDVEILYRKNLEEIEYCIPLKNNIKLIGGFCFIDSKDEADVEDADVQEMIKDGIQEVYLRFEAGNSISQEITNHGEALNPAILKKISNNVLSLN